MRKTAVGYSIGKLMQVMGVALLVPFGIAIYDSRHLQMLELFSTPEVFGFALAVIASVIFGTALVMFCRGGRDLQGIREGYAIVTIGWFTLAFLASIPLFSYFVAERGGGFAGLALSFTDAYFEVMSGFTTTGASILSDVESMPRSLFLLRARSEEHTSEHQ